MENKKDNHLSETRYERFLKDQSLYGIQQNPKNLWSWKSILLAILLFIILFCLFATATTYNFAFLYLVFGIDDNDGLLGLYKLGGMVLLIPLFLIPLTLYFSFYCTRTLLNNNYNKMPLIDNKKSLILWFVMVFIFSFFICSLASNMLLALLMLYLQKYPQIDNLRYLPHIFYFFALGLSFYVTKKIIKKLNQGLTYDK